MKRVLEIGVVLVATLSLVGVALGPCCASTPAGCSEATGSPEDHGQADTSMGGHCEGAATLATSARCCGTAERAGTDYIGAPSKAGTLQLSALSASTVITRQASAAPTDRPQARTSSRRSPVLRL